MQSNSVVHDVLDQEVADEHSDGKRHKDEAVSGTNVCLPDSPCCDVVASKDSLAQFVSTQAKSLVDKEDGGNSILNAGQDNAYDENDDDSHREKEDCGSSSDYDCEDEEEEFWGSPSDSDFEEEEFEEEILYEEETEEAKNGHDVASSSSASSEDELESWAHSVASSSDEDAASVCADMGKPLRLMINSLAGELCQVNVTQGCFAHEVKLAVNVATGIKLAEQQLVLGDKELSDGSRIQAQDMETVLLVRRSPEEAKWMSIILGGCSTWHGMHDCPIKTFFKTAPTTIRENRALQLALLNNRGRHRCLLWDPSSLQAAIRNIAATTSDRELALAIACFAENALQWLPDLFRKDWRLVLTACHHFQGAIKFADEKLRKDPKLFARVVQKHGLALEFAPPAIKADRKVVTIAVQQNWQAIKFAGTACLKDRTVVLTAVRKDWQALQFAHRCLQADREVVSAALDQSWQALRYADKAICHRDRSLVLQAVNQNADAYKLVVGELRDDEEVLLAVVAQNWHLLTPGSCSSLKVMLAAVQHDWRALSCACPELRNNRKLILAAVSVDDDAWWYVGDDPEFDSEKWPQIKEDAHSFCENSSKELVDEAIKYGWLSTYCAGDHEDAKLFRCMVQESVEQAHVGCGGRAKQLLGAQSQTLYTPFVLGEEI